MKLNLIKKIKYLYLVFRIFFLSVNWYESFAKRKIIKGKIKNKKIKLVVLKSKIKANKFYLHNYFNNYKDKLKRFNKKNYFIVLTKNKHLLSSGWIYFGNKWKITEINLNIKLGKKYLLYDFETPKNLRNQGHYTLLLSLIQKKFYGNKLAIYSLSNNYESNRAIKKSGFKFTKKLTNRLF